MKIHTLTAALLLSIPVAFAQQQQETPKSTSSPAEPGAAQAQTTAPQAAQTPTVADIMAKRLEEMQSHWDKMSKTKDPAERQKLMEEHRQKMQELSALMGDWRSSQGMMGGGRMGHGMMGHGQGMGMMGGGQGMGMMQGCPMMQHQQQMEQRLDTIQKLLEQLLAQQQGKS